MIYFWLLSINDGPTLGYKKNTTPFSPANVETSTVFPSSSSNLMLGSLSPIFNTSPSSSSSRSSLSSSGVISFFFLAGAFLGLLTAATTFLALGDRETPSVVISALSEITSTSSLFGLDALDFLGAVWGPSFSSSLSARTIRYALQLSTDASMWCDSGNTFLALVDLLRDVSASGDMDVIYVCLRKRDNALRGKGYTICWQVGVVILPRRVPWWCLDRHGWRVINRSPARWKDLRICRTSSNEERGENNNLFFDFCCCFRLVVSQIPSFPPPQKSKPAFPSPPAPAHSSSVRYHRPPPSRSPGHADHSCRHRAVSAFDQACRRCWQFIPSAEGLSLLQHR